MRSSISPFPKACSRASSPRHPPTVRARLLTVTARLLTVRARLLTVRARLLTVRARLLTVRARLLTVRARLLTVTPPTRARGRVPSILLLVHQIGGLLLLLLAGRS